MRSTCSIPPQRRPSSGAAPRGSRPGRWAWSPCWLVVVTPLPFRATLTGFTQECDRRMDRAVTRPSLARPAGGDGERHVERGRRSLPPAQPLAGLDDERQERGEAEAGEPLAGRQAL